MAKANGWKSHQEESTPKYLLLFQQLVQRIEQGAWGEGRVPTVREIAQDFGVSSFTASRALHLLEEKGLIVTKQRSGSFLAPAQATRDTNPSWAVLLRVSPGPWHDASQAVVKLGFDAMPQSAGSFLCGKWELPVGSRPAGARSAVLDMVQAGTKGLFFLPSRVSDEETEVDEALLEACDRNGLPVVLIDRNLRGTARELGRDLIASDHFDGGARSTRHLLDQGRKRVACVLASPTSSHNERLSGYLFALQTDPHQPEPLVIWVPAKLETRDVYSWLATELLDRGVDGVLCYQDYTAVGLIMELLRRGVDIPGKMGVVGCDDLPIGNSFSLGVTTYAYPSREICQVAWKVMRNRIEFPEDPPSKTLVAGRLIVRESSRLI